jgi:hypothetical protein
MCCSVKRDIGGAIGIRQVRRVGAYEPLQLRGGPDDAAIRRTFTTMQQMIRCGRLGEGIMFSIHESVDRELRRGTCRAGSALLCTRSRPVSELA